VVLVVKSLKHDTNQQLLVDTINKKDMVLQEPEKPIQESMAVKALKKTSKTPYRPAVEQENLGFLPEI
jgi:hypothetical protein